MNLLKLKLSYFFSFIILSGTCQQNQLQFDMDDLWAKGVSCFLNEDNRCSILYFEQLLHLIEPDNAKFNPANYYIAHSYRSILKTTGLNKTEADRMFECYRFYLDAPVTLMNEEQNKEVEIFLERKRKSQPTDGSKKWIDKTD